MQFFFILNKEKEGRTSLSLVKVRRLGVEISSNP